MVAWTLVFHIIGLVFWLGSLLGVTQILAIHTEETSPEARVTLERLESKLLKGLAHPGAALMVITGFLLVSQNPQYLREHWLHGKLLLVIILVGLDLRVTFRARAFQEGKIELSRRECMALHGAISVVFFAILILVLIKPFGLHRRQAQLGETGSDDKGVFATRRTLARGHPSCLAVCVGKARGTEEAITPGVCCVAMLISCNLQPEGFLKNQH